MKPKRMKLHEAVVGAKAVVNDLPDTQVYTIKQVKNYQVHLVYFEHGKEYSGSWIDVSYCYHPSDVQLNHSLTQ